MKRPYPDPQDLHPGDRGVVVLELRIMCRRETPHGVRYRVELPRELRPEDFVSAEVAAAMAQRSRKETR